MKGELDLKKKANMDILERKEKMEIDVHAMQEKTELQDSLYKELHLINDSLKRIKKNELEAMEEDRGAELFEG
eukprot:CAMPEP_0170467882 /NCGR_PEP_ID=MMETSP0123-20130129/11286_1 /TAXON_ID=182087 /ORGANISM="Favella ehrenbergii, Strain Fehren 1" /LENGTH=72 /DNA_ID=CAMNT_0010734343 /DNA_START=688 /DNA_END=906 /DNA_ORIENTATION=+